MITNDQLYTVMQITGFSSDISLKLLSEEGIKSYICDSSGYCTTVKIRATLDGFLYRTLL